jgi:hypothetical protein
MLRTQYAMLPVLTIFSLAVLPNALIHADGLHGTTGQMVFDDVGRGLDLYCKEKNEDKRIHLLARLAPTRDPRVAVVLGECLAQWLVDVHRGVPSKVNTAAVRLLDTYYLPKSAATMEEGRMYLDLRVIFNWWTQHKAELRHRMASP